MSATRIAHRTHRPVDDGFTLVEVIAALAIVGIVASTALYFFVNGTRSITHQSRTQSAVTVANESMEDAFAVSAKPVTKGPHQFSGLLRDRPQAAVEQAWAAAQAAGLDGLDQTYPAWDPQPATGAAPAVPITRTTVLDKVEYTSTILIGTCYRPTGGASQDCTRTGAGATPPAVTPANTVRLLRVMALVQWPDLTGSCGGTCTYQTQSLVDPNEDIVWNNTTRPIAVDDNTSVPVGEWVDVPVLLNDVLGPVTSNPVVNVTAPTFGTVAPAPTTGQLRYTAPPNRSGVATFTYQLKDRAGHMSDVATVRVTVTGKARDDTASAIRNQVVTIPVLDNDLGTPTAVVIDTPPTGASVNLSNGGRTVDFRAATDGTYTFRYHFTDGTSDSTQAVVTVVVTNYAPPLVSDFVANVPATMSLTDFDIDMLGKTGNPEGYLYEIVSMSVNQGQLKIDGPLGVRNVNMSNYKRGTRFLYAAQTNTLGTWTFQYRVFDPEGGQGSAVKTVTLRIVPVAVDFTYQVRTGVNEARIDLKNQPGMAPTNFSGTVKLVDGAFPSCVVDPGGQEYHNGIIKIRTTNKKAGTCTMRYQLASPSDPAVVSEVKTITIVVK
ncbi:Ig-like domain-containing protein [Cellulomonas iranensis]|uniref:Prepilin-type N-terminal cleavage/methylation domain-containing protein n=1 Tax=Cellulomonas iranensis TaxID=76862 RepID=A0ABU0GNX4_9CELL|nr:Ig-like domain-containing protein [Cellulomonas iranensis]MDQ0427070.1 prepilin-type N-terminal cleavage/methylation domain-containing protein [Cellulomonas iranensis]